MSFESILNSEFQVKESEMKNINGGVAAAMESTGSGTIVTADGVHHKATDYLDSNGNVHYQF